MSATVDRRSIFDIGADLREVEEALEEDAGELSPELEAFFDQLSEERDLKIDRYCYLIDELDAHAKYLRDEAKRMAEWAATNENKVKRLKGRLFEFFQAHHLQRLVTPHWKPRIQNNGGLLPLVVKVEPTKLPEEFQKVTVEANNDAIREYLEAGGELEYAELLPRGQHLRIR